MTQELHSSILLINFIYLFFLAVLDLHYYLWAFSSWGEQELLSNCHVQASPCSGFFCFQAQALGLWASGFAGCEL